MQGLDQTSLPGTDINEFWANGYLTLNKWSHLALTYNLSTKEVQFYINGELDAVTSFAGNLPFPLNNGFRLGPTDDYQATSTKGGIDDFRIYGASLSAVEIRRLYGGGNGDFNQKTIQFSYTDELELPKVVDVYFLDDGMPVSLVSSGGDAFDEGDIVDINSTIFGLVEVGTGHYQFELLPDDNSTPRNLFVMINGSGMKTAGFGDSFNDSNFSLSYNPQIPVVLSPSVSYWSRGTQSIFKINVSDATAISLSALPPGLEYNATSRQIVGAPEAGGSHTITITASNPISSVNQQHELKVVDSLSFSSKLELSLNSSALGENPSNLVGLSMHLNASSLPDENGSILSVWSDSSGNERGLNRVRGVPRVLFAPELENKKVVSFDGLSQMYSSYDFGGLLNDYTIVAVARYTGGQNDAVIASVGSEWVFGLGGGKSSYWKLGNNEISGPSADTNWHIFSGTLDINGELILRRDGYDVASMTVPLNSNAKPKYFALGGAQTNDGFSKAEVAEVVLYNRVLFSEEILKLENHFRSKWLGGALDDFPLLVRLSSNSHPDFDLLSFADPATGGDLRFYDEYNRELAFEIDEWNTSGESTVWVKVLELNENSKIYAYWGNDNNTTLPAHDVWSDYEGVWHLTDSIESSNAGRNATTEGSVNLGDSGLIGRGLSLTSSGNLVISGYAGITADHPRTVSLWMKSVDNSGQLGGWGDGSNNWSISWNSQGPQVATGNGGIRQGSGFFAPGQWHHLTVSYPGNGADLNQTRIYWDGVLVDVPASSVSAVVNTSNANDLRIGSYFDGTNRMSGSLDEYRVSNQVRGPAWAAYEYQNQKAGGSLLSYDLKYQSAPILPSDLNLTIVRGVPFSFQVSSSPPAFSYSVSSGSLPSGLTINSATGLIEGNTTDPLGSLPLTLSATNSKGTTQASLNIIIQDTLSAPEISPGMVVETFGRGAHIRGNLTNSGGSSNQVTIYYGLADAGQIAGDWNHSLSLGSKDQGGFDVLLQGLDSGKTYYYRFLADNSQTAWSDVGSFSTLRFDQGILRINTGLDDLGANAGIFWDRNNGEGEQKVYDANVSTVSYLAPDGSAWKVSKATFQITENLLFGENLQEIILEGVNSLSLDVDGNITVAKNLIGSPSPALPHLPGGTLTDGYDGYYANDPAKGLHMGKASLGGFGGGKGPGKGESLGATGAGGVTGGGGSYAGEGGSAASGPAGIRYGNGGLDLLIGGSGGGIGNGGEAGAGGGAIEMISSGTVRIEPGVRVAMNGGTVFVNPTVGANFSGGAGSGGAVRILATNIENLGVIEVKGGDSSGMDSREPGSKYLRDAGGAGGGGRVALLADGSISKGMINLNGGLANADGAAGFPGSLFVGPKSSTMPISLSVTSGTLVLDTGGSWSHSSSLSGKGQITSFH